ncbi:hypothetical protein [Georgenia thermotolerans]|uniref:Uncharacterized protein n=1 Tax=Georgenia thermotolerans TaxID=527326 RepID=A0A7J5UNF4_9MICO|nr:hypothetical protein [Georgenia thermotolerans]KAE8763915.1 hypothetical protein GB883_11720 [Georgenia thermotolerans]
MEPDIAGPALVLGSVRGRRSFCVLPDGRLTGVFFPQVWQPGENRASCFHDGGVVVREPDGRLAVRGYSVRDIGAAHGLQGCTCGFYAYYRADPYARPRRVSGIIEGYGRVVLGTKGFRAQKARLVALVLPEELPGSENAPTDAVPADGRLAPGDGARVRERYPDVAVFPREEAMVVAFPPTEDGPTL